MKVILDNKVKNEIWDKIYNDFKFNPSTDTSIKTFEFPIHHEQFKLKSIWNEEQEKIVNNIFKELSDDDIYALEWQSDCFEFNPNEDIEYEYSYHDDERNVEVYFPTYYPDGDYYFFIAKDFSYGMFTHPWKKQIYIWGEKLINKINQNVDILNLEKISNNTSTPKFKKIKEIYNCKPDNVNEISPLSKWYNKLIDKTIDEITENDVEIMIRQNILLELALKKAIEFLNIDVFAGPKCTAGILIHVSKIDISYLKNYSKELQNISLNALSKSKKWEFIDDEEKKEIQEAIKTILEKITKNNSSNNKSNHLIIGFSILLSIALIILAITLTTTKHGWLQGIGIILVAFITYILYSKISNKKEHKENNKTTHNHLSKCYNITDLYENHMKIYNDTVLCEKIDEITKMFHELELCYRKTIGLSPYDGYEFDIIQINDDSIENTILNTKKKYYNISDISNINSNMNSQMITEINDIKQAIHLLFTSYILKNTEINHNLDVFTKALVDFCGNFKHIYEITNACEFFSDIGFYHTNSAYYLVFDKYIVLVEYGSDE